MENKPKHYQKPNMLIWGLSGAGKDTTLNILTKNHSEYLRLRLAETIKRVITETRGVSFDRIEEIKRADPTIRQAHHDVDKYLREQIGKPELISSVIRAELICNRKSMDFTNPILINTQQSLKENPIVIMDARAKDELTVFFNNGFLGIFLTRLPGEWKNSAHETENNPILDGWLLEQIKTKKIYAEQIIIINNDDVKEMNDACKELISLGVDYHYFGRIESSQFKEKAEKVLNVTVDSLGNYIYR